MKHSPLKEKKKKLLKSPSDGAFYGLSDLIHQKPNTMTDLVHQKMGPYFFVLSGPVIDPSTFECFLQGRCLNYLCDNDMILSFNYLLTYIFFKNIYKIFKSSLAISRTEARLNWLGLGPWTLPGNIFGPTAKWVGPSIYMIKGSRSDLARYISQRGLYIFYKRAGPGCVWA